jgi:glycosyltransferase involved in cell wall biosynthesis
VSVVIPTYNRAGDLERILSSYLQQPCVMEVIVVDDGSTDRTPTLLQHWPSADVPLRAVRLARNRGQGHARNVGVDVALGDYVFFGEDDYALAPDQVPTLLRHLERTGGDMIAGRRVNVRPDESDADALRRASQYRDPLIERWAAVQNPWVDVGGDVDAPLLDACVLVRREVFRQIRFDPAFRGNGWREESDFQLAALEAGHRLIHCSHTIGFHHPRGVGRGKGGARGRGRLDYEWWVVRNNAYFLRKHWSFLHAGACDLRVPPTLGLAVLLQALLRGARAGRKLSRSWPTRLPHPAPRTLGKDDRCRAASASAAPR